MKPITKILNEPDKKWFEKAFKFYYFSRQQAVDELNSTLQERLYVSGQIAYSVLSGFIMENSVKTEFVEFLDLEIESLSTLDHELLKPLAIKPNEIESLEIDAAQQLKVFDEDFAGHFIISYLPEDSEVNLVVCD